MIFPLMIRNKWYLRQTNDPQWYINFPSVEFRSVLFGFHTKINKYIKKLKKKIKKIWGDFRFILPRCFKLEDKTIFVVKKNKNQQTNRKRNMRGFYIYSSKLEDNTVECIGSYKEIWCTDLGPLVRCYKHYTIETDAYLKVQYERLVCRSALW
jgi:hypothetical protein